MVRWLFQHPQVDGLCSWFTNSHIFLDGSRQRPYDTVKPLAKDLGLKVDTFCNRDDADCVANVVNSYGGSGNILICWEHDRLSDIVQALGDDNPPSYPDDR